MFDAKESWPERLGAVLTSLIVSATVIPAIEYLLTTYLFSNDASVTTWARTYLGISSGEVAQYLARMVEVALDLFLYGIIAIPVYLFVKHALQALFILACSAVALFAFTHFFTQKLHRECAEAHLTPEQCQQAGRMAITKNY